jgi:hypothetical protein
MLAQALSLSLSLMYAYYSLYYLLRYNLLESKGSRYFNRDLLNLSSKFSIFRFFLFKVLPTIKSNKIHKLQNISKFPIIFLPMARTVLSRPPLVL